MAKYYTDPATGQRVEIKQTHKVRNFIVLPAVALIALIAVIAGTTSGEGTAPAATPSPVPAAETDPSTAPAPTSEAGDGHTVVYEVTGEGTGSVTYVTDENMSMSQDTSATLPWSQQLTINSWFAPLSMNVQHMSGSGPISCKITVDGEVVSENTAQGAYAIASCSGQIN